MTDKLSTYLGLPPLEGEEPDTPIQDAIIEHSSPAILKGASVLATSPGDDAEDDYKYVRAKLKHVIDKGTGALDILLGLADSSQDPKAYEVVSMNIKALVHANRELVSISKDRAIVAKGLPETAVTNNNLIITTKELLSRYLGDKDE